MNSAEENKQTLQSSVCCMYTLALNELKAVLKVSAQAGQSDVMNKTSLETTV
jgi:hypothetical protein